MSNADGAARLPITTNLRAKMRVTTDADSGSPRLDCDSIGFGFLCDAIDSVHSNLERENERLKADNAKLRNDADLLRAMWEQARLEAQGFKADNAELRETLQRRSKQLDGMIEMWGERGVENAKLRGLVADTWRLFTKHGAVHPSDLPEVDAVRDRIRELGVEVVK